MPQHEFAGACVARHHGRLRGRGVIVELGAFRQTAVISGLVVYRRDPLYHLPEPWHIARVATIGITARLIGWRHQSVMGYDLAVRSDPVGAVFDIGDLAHRYIVKVYHVATNVRQHGALPEKIATAWYAVLQRDGLHGNAAVLIDDKLTLRLHRVKHHVKFEAGAKQFYHGVEHGPQVGRRVHMEWRRAPKHAKSGNEPYQPKAMVAMQVGYEDGLYLCETHMRPAQLHLRALAAIHHEKFSAHLHHLRRGVMFQRRRGASTTKDMYLERFHTGAQGTNGVMAA